jgi:hypothetical protein
MSLIRYIFSEKIVNPLGPGYLILEQNFLVQIDGSIPAKKEARTSENLFL